MEQQMSDVEYVVVKDAGDWGLELYLWSQPCDPGHLLVFGCEKLPTVEDWSQHRLDVLHINKMELSRGRETLSETNPRTRWMLAKYKSFLLDCGLPIPTLIYRKRDAAWLRALREKTTHQQRRMPH